MAYGEMARDLPAAEAEIPFVYGLCAVDFAAVLRIERVQLPKDRNDHSR